MPRFGMERCSSFIYIIISSGHSWPPELFKTVPLIQVQFYNCVWQVTFIIKFQYSVFNNETIVEILLFDTSLMVMRFKTDWYIMTMKVKLSK